MPEQCSHVKEGTKQAPCIQHSFYSMLKLQLYVHEILCLIHATHIVKKHVLLYKDIN